MKIKEVVEKTGLTDRAVRLYINEGLAAPNIEESYSGRKNIEFSQADVERLNNVALLRKAGFSIADIKSIVDDETTAKGIVEKFIEQTENNIEHETEIVEKLKSISFDGEVTLETICESLFATVEENEVPSEDLTLTTAEKVKKWLFIGFAIVQILFSALMLVFVCMVNFDFRFIQFDLYDSWPLVIYGCWLIVLIESIFAVWLNTGVRNYRRKKKSTKRAINEFAADLIIGVVVFEIFFVPCTCFLLIFGETPFYSQTTDPNNYLKLDRSLESYDDNYCLDSLFEVFPRKIPKSAKNTYESDYPETTKYFYEYTNCCDYYYETYDICAEWVLPYSEYEKAKSDLPGDFLLEENLLSVSQSDADEEYIRNNNDYKIVDRGDWTFVYYQNWVSFGKSQDVTDKSESELRYEESENEFDIEEWNTDDYQTSYDFLICAYNDQQQKIRYIASNCCGHEPREEGPYYLSLEW